MAVLTPDIAKTELAIIELTNVFRAEQKLAPVKSNPALTAAARAYAKFLASSEMFSHTADGRQPQDRVKAAGYEYCRTAENLALNLDSRGFQTAQLARDAVEGWKNSPGHRKNLEAPHVTEIGVGIAKSKTEEKYLSVQLFGRPMSLQYEFKIMNEAGVPVSYRYNGETQTVGPRIIVTHTACDPGEITFVRSSTQTARVQADRATDVNFPTNNGDTFSLVAAPGGGVRVDVNARKK
jgi:Cysteine-rich secretory protein family